MKQRLLPYFDILLIVLFAIIPLWSTFPYRVNIFLSWEGAYRLSEGQTAFQDFGLPMGYMYWVVPAAFFKLFGPGLLTLVKAQAFINILAGLAFRSILKSFDLPAGLRFVSVLLFCISYSFFNFWPWYNHTVIVYQLVAFAFLFKGLFATRPRLQQVWLLLAGAMLFVSFFTKQDGGGLAILIALVLTLSYSVLQRRLQIWLPLLGGFAITAVAILWPLRGTEFSYWFNHGQPPHNSRLSAFDIVDEFFVASQWIKVYLLLIALLMAQQVANWRSFRQQPKAVLHLLLTLGILAEASIFQVTSYTPPDNNIFFHSFAVSYLLYQLSQRLPDIQFSRPRVVVFCSLGILLWWSGNYWKYANRIIDRIRPKTEGIAAAAVGKNTYTNKVDTLDVPMSKWTFSKRKGFEGIYMPPSTVAGIERLFEMPAIANSAAPRKVLNLTELTPLRLELQNEMEKGPQTPLWHHRGVAMFDRETKQYTDKISKQYYDVVLFEYMPELNNFFPFEIRDSLLVHYQLVDSFHAPRRPTHEWIEVFARKTNPAR